MAAEVGRVPGRDLAGPGPVVRQLLQALEEPGERMPEVVGPLGEVLPRCDVQRGAEGEVDAPAPGQVGGGSGSPTENSRWVPQTATGTRGAPVSLASDTAPRISGRTV